MEKPVAYQSKQAIHRPARHNKQFFLFMVPAISLSIGVVVFIHIFAIGKETDMNILDIPNLRPMHSLNQTVPSQSSVNETITDERANLDTSSSLPSWLHNYSLFHADQLQNHQDTAKFLVYSCAKGDWCGGIGDRIRGIITCFYLAVATDRVFLIHNPSPVDLGIMLNTSMIDWKTHAGSVMGKRPYTIRAVDKVRQMAPKLWSDFTGHQYVNIKTNMMLFEEVLSRKEFESSLKAKGIPFNQWQPPYGEILATWGWKMLFKPTVELEEVIKEKKLRIGLNSASSNQSYIAVHIRHGGHWGDGVRHGLERNDEFVECTKLMTEVLSAKENNSPNVYIASDDNKAAEKFREGVPGALSDLGPGYHIEKTKRASDMRKSNLDVWAEFFIISQAECIVYSRSGFSEMAVSMSRHMSTGARCAAQFEFCNTHDIEKSMSTLTPLQQWVHWYNMSKRELS